MAPVLLRNRTRIGNQNGGSQILPTDSEIVDSSVGHMHDLASTSTF